MSNPLHFQLQNLAVHPAERLLFYEKEVQLTALAKEKQAALAEAFESLRSPNIAEEGLLGDKRCSTPLEYRAAQEQLTTLGRKRDLQRRIFEVLKTPQFWTQLNQAPNQNRFGTLEHQNLWNQSRAFWLMPASQLVHIAQKSIPLLEQMKTACQDEVRQKLGSHVLEHAKDFLPLKRIEQDLDELEKYLEEVKKQLADEMALRLKAADFRKDPQFDDPLNLLSAEVSPSESDPTKSIFNDYTKETGEPRRSLTHQAWRVFSLFIRQWGSHESKEIYRTLSWQEEQVCSPFFALVEFDGTLVPKQHNIPGKGELPEIDNLTLLNLFYSYLKVFQGVEESCGELRGYDQIVSLLKEVEQAIALYAAEIERVQQDKKSSTYLSVLIVPLFQQYLTLERGLYSRAMLLLTQSQHTHEEKAERLKILWESFVTKGKERSIWKNGGQVQLAAHTQELQFLFQRAEQEVLGQSLAKRALSFLLKQILNPDSCPRTLDNPQGNTWRLKEPDITQLYQSLRVRALQLPDAVCKAFEVVIKIATKKSVKQDEFFSALQAIAKHSSGDINVQSLCKLILSKWLIPLLRPGDEALRQFIGLFPFTMIPSTFGDVEKRSYQWVMDFLKSPKPNQTVVTETHLQELLQLKIALGSQSDKKKAIEDEINKYITNVPPKEQSVFELIVDQLGTHEQIQRYGRKRFRWLLRQQPAALFKHPFFLYHYETGILTDAIHKELIDFSDHHALKLSPTLLEKYARDESVRKSLLELYDKSMVTALQTELETPSSPQAEGLQQGSLPFPGSSFGVSEIYKWSDQVVYLPWSMKGATLLARFGVDRLLTSAYLKKYFSARLVIHSSTTPALPPSLSESYKVAGVWAKALQDPLQQFVDKGRQLLKQGNGRPLQEPLSTLHSVLTDKECPLQILPAVFYGYSEIQAQLSEIQGKMDESFNSIAPLFEKKNWPRILEMLIESYQSLQLAVTVADETGFKQECDNFQSLLVYLMDLPFQDRVDEFDKATKSWLFTHRSSFKPTPKLVEFFSRLAFLAVEKNHPACFRILDDWGINRKMMGQRGITFLHHAAFYGSLSILQQMKSWPDFKIDALSEDKSTALHAAARNNHFQVVEWLIEEGCPVDLVNEYERTPLTQAAYAGAVESVERLLKTKADRKRKPKSTDGPVHAAVLGAERGENVSKKRKAILELLLSAGADVNEKNSEGKTILHLILVSWSEHSILAVEAVLKFLIDQNANCDATDQQGLTPAALAERRGNKALGDLLLKLKRQKQHPLATHPSGDNLLTSAKP